MNAHLAPDDSLVDLLSRTARRGVDVRLLVGGERTDIRITWQAGRARDADQFADRPWRQRLGEWVADR